MRQINLYLLTREQEPGLFSAYEAHLSGRGQRRQANGREQESLRVLVEDLLRDEGAGGLSPRDLDGFYYSYTIRHISKEFDLLKFPKGKNAVLNIELKSGDVGEERIREQLLQNRTYLGHLSDTIYSYTYVSSLHRLYCLNAHSYLQQVPLESLRALLRDPAFWACREEDIDALFDAVYYLISPITTPERFLNGEYFLTSQQMQFRTQILAALRSGKRPLLIGIGGSAGTGKTLLLYDLAMALSKKRRVTILHCGHLAQGHRILDRKLKNVTIVGLAEHPDFVPEGTDYLLVDEAGRLSLEAFQALTDKVRQAKLPCLFCYDSARFRFADESGRALLSCMREKMDLSLSLSGNIRINRNLARFVRFFFDQRDLPPERSFPSVLVRLAHGQKERALLGDLLREEGYVLFGEGVLPEPGDETDKVAVLLGKPLAYDGQGCLFAGEGEEGLLTLRHLYDEVSRAREQLCLLVCDNDPLFASLMEMLGPAPERGED